MVQSNMVPPIKSVQSIRYLDCLVSSVGPNCSLFEVLGQNELSSLFDVRAFCPFLKFFLFGLFADLKKFSNFNLVIELILRKVSSWFIAELLIIYAIKCVNCRQWSFKIHFFSSGLSYSFSSSELLVAWILPKAKTCYGKKCWKFFETKIWFLKLQPWMKKHKYS